MPPPSFEALIGRRTSSDLYFHIDRWSYPAGTYVPLIDRSAAFEHVYFPQVSREDPQRVLYLRKATSPLAPLLNGDGDSLRCCDLDGANDRHVIGKGDGLNGGSVTNVGHPWWDPTQADRLIFQAQVSGVHSGQWVFYEATLDPGTGGVGAWLSWPLNETNVADGAPVADDSGNGRTGEIEIPPGAGLASDAPGLHGGSSRCIRNTTGVSGPGPLLRNVTFPAPAAFSIETWVELPNVASGVYQGFAQVADVDGLALFWAATPQEILVRLRYGANITDVSFDPVPPGVHHIVATFELVATNSGRVTLFVDGVQAAQLGSIPVGAGLTFGAGQVDVVFAAMMLGWRTDTSRVYDVVLSPAQVAALYAGHSLTWAEVLRRSDGMVTDCAYDGLGRILFNEGWSNELVRLTPNRAAWPLTIPGGAPYGDNPAWGPWAAANGAVRLTSYVPDFPHVNAVGGWDPYAQVFDPASNPSCTRYAHLQNNGYTPPPGVASVNEGMWSNWLIDPDGTDNACAVGSGAPTTGAAAASGAWPAGITGPPIWVDDAWVVAPRKTYDAGGNQSPAALVAYDATGADLMTIILPGVAEYAQLDVIQATAPPPPPPPEEPPPFYLPGSGTFCDGFSRSDGDLDRSQWDGGPYWNVTAGDPQIVGGQWLHAYDGVRPVPDTVWAWAKGVIGPAAAVLAVSFVVEWGDTGSGPMVTVLVAPEDQSGVPLHGLGWSVAPGLVSLWYEDPDGTPRASSDVTVALTAGYTHSVVLRATVGVEATLSVDDVEVTAIDASMVGTFASELVVTLAQGTPTVGDYVAVDDVCVALGSTATVTEAGEAPTYRQWSQTREMIAYTPPHEMMAPTPPQET